MRRFAAVSFVALIVASGASLLLSHAYNSADIMDEATNIIDIVAQEAQAAVNGTTYDELTSESDTEGYDATRETIQLVCSLLNVRNLTIYELNDDESTLTCLLIVSGDDEEDERLQKEVPHGFVMEKKASQKELNVLSGASDSEAEITEGIMGRNLSWFFPVEVEGCDDDLLMRIDVDDSELLGKIFDNTLAFAIPMIAINMGVVVIEVVMLRRDVSNPLKVVSARMRGFVRRESSREGESHEEPLEMKRDDEIGEICDSYNKMTGDIHEYVGQIESMTRERVAANTELSVARRIQQGLVPPSTELAGDGFEAFASMRMAREVGGDFYDLSVLGDGRLMFVLADVSGKGVSAALFMAMSRTLIYEKMRTCLDPAKALNEANDSIASNNPECMFVTLVAGLLDPATGVITYANAGHLAPLVVGGEYLGQSDGIVLGLFEGAGIVNETVRLEPGEGILFYTDGATEANNAQADFFGEQRLCDAVAGASCAVDAVHSAVEAIDLFVAGHEQFDDLTLLSIFAR
ncbi:MAG: PP2C family protein-serine/threonine phosphatase [Atopobiaceae bacterium]|nr:PP2C family protein-serine/threonine phosphatase [Atopobiaceae bacterium]